MEWEFNSYYTLIAATLVLLVGKFLVQKIKFLRDFNIPSRSLAVWLPRLSCLRCTRRTA
ncbi:glutamate permease [Neisseria meningitidis]|nr:glutamate permease [Neisseria meningitidis]